MTKEDKIAKLQEDFYSDAEYLIWKIADIRDGQDHEHTDKALEKLHVAVQDFCGKWGYLDSEYIHYINHNVVLPLRKLLVSKMPGSYIATRCIWPTK